MKNLSFQKQLLCVSQGYIGCQVPGRGTATLSTSSSIPSSSGWTVIHVATHCDRTTSSSAVLAVCRQPRAQALLGPGSWCPAPVKSSCLFQEWLKWPFCLIDNPLEEVPWSATLAVGGSQGIQGLLLAVKTGEGVSFRKRREATQGDICLFFIFKMLFIYFWDRILVYCSPGWPQTLDTPFFCVTLCLCQSFWSSFFQ